MNLFCNEETKCNNRVTLPGGYCYLHLHKKNKPLVLNKRKILLTNANNKKKIILPNKKILPVQDCYICLCEIDETEEDTGLICMHRFHVDCLNHVEKSTCPVCRVPLEFIKPSKVDINKIKHKESQELSKNKQKQILEDTALSRRLRAEEEEQERQHNHYIDDFDPYQNNDYVEDFGYHNYNDGVIFDMTVLMRGVEELNETEQINQAIKNSLLMI